MCLNETRLLLQSQSQIPTPTFSRPRGQTRLSECRFLSSGEHFGWRKSDISIKYGRELSVCSNEKSLILPALVHQPHLAPH